MIGRVDARSSGEPGMRWWVLLLTGAALCTAMLAAALAPSPSPTENRLGDPAPVPNSAVHHGPAAIATLCISWALFALFAARGVLALSGSPEAEGWGRESAEVVPTGRSRLPS